ncbi:FAD dependent oxidoreductase [Gigaspora margarita]|uniref:FAD dependent oxidoreductase n=1 Tax=Gigaspora margarita TaxID=4874 RepID=A0A8H3WVF5_GIGMA|nr:FAD dependent oxidoreductase [Gigaspora margarita]KAF0333081.1 FAD dependent oxidoreductase [Gigaspora margarita]
MDLNSEFDRETYNHLWKLAKTQQNETGIMTIDEFEYWERFPQNFSDPWFKTLCHEYRHLRKEELPNGVEFGITYKSVSINPQTYLKYLLNIFTLMGGTTQRAELSHLNECIKNETDIVINCSGVHSRTLKEKTDNKSVLTYVIPHDEEEVILGGTYEENNYSTDVDYDAAARIIQRCLAICPDLLPKDQAQLTIKGYGVGLRPCRKGGVRVDAEWITSEKISKKILIGHNYGHGGAGFESSYGAANHLIKVMKGMLNDL